MNISSNRPRVFFICGSFNQTTQLHKIAQQLTEVEAHYSPYYGDAYLTKLRRLGLLESTIAGDKLRGRCLEYLTREGLSIDLDGGRGGYDLVVSCSDVVVPRNVRRHPLLVVQEGITDPEGYLFDLVRRFPHALPRWIAGTAATGLSGAYERFCVASEGYRRYFIERGAPAERVVATGMPNFDDCMGFTRNDFPYRGYVLACTSDARETYKLDDRKRFIRHALAVAGGRMLFFKLHPNENVERATREIRTWAPGSRVFSAGRTEEMIANADALVTQFSSVVFVGLALGKEVHSYHSLELLRSLVPFQHGRAAQNIAIECRKLLAVRPRLVEAEPVSRRLKVA